MAFVNQGRHVGGGGDCFGGVWCVSGNTVAIGTSAILPPSPVHGSDGGAGVGSQTDAMAFSWLVSESYNGSNWATGPTIPTFTCNVSGALGHAGGAQSAGTTSAALAINGSNVFGNGGCPNVSEWDGTSWTSGTSTLTNRAGQNQGTRSAASAGTSTACYYAGGNDGTGVGNANHYNPDFVEWNGTTWARGGATLGGNGINLHNESGPMGTQTAGLMVGGHWGQVNGSAGQFWWQNNSDRCEEYDGTSSAYGGNLNHKRSGHWQIGSQTNAYACFGADTDAGSRITEKYDGSTWSVTAFAITAPAGITGAALASSDPGCGSTSTGYGMSIGRDYPAGVFATAQTDNFSP
jgi:hypothetical protein